MTVKSQPALTFVVTIDFQSDGVTFAQDASQVEAMDEYDAERLGRMRGQDRAYHELRVPGFGIIVQVNQVEGGDHGSGQPARDDAGSSPECDA